MSFTINHFSPCDTQDAPTVRPMESIEMLADWLPSARENIACIAVDLPHGSATITYGDPGDGKVAIETFTSKTLRREFNDETEAETYFIQQIRRLS